MISIWQFAKWLFSCQIKIYNSLTLGAWFLNGLGGSAIQGIAQLKITTLITIEEAID